MIKQAIITLNYVKNNDELYTLLRQVCVTSIRDYAKRMDIDFILMNNNNDRYDGTVNQFQCLEYLDYYDKIMYIDGDCYIPKLFNINILDMVNMNEIGLSKILQPYDYNDIYDCYIKYPFVILVITKNTRNIFKPYLKNITIITDKYEEILLNKIMQSCEDKIAYLPYFKTYYFIPLRHDIICHLLCNKNNIHKYKKILIDKLKNFKNLKQNEEQI